MTLTRPEAGGLGGDRGAVESAAAWPDGDGAWYRANEQMLGNVLFDVDPGIPPPTTPDAFEMRMGALVGALMEGWQVGPDRGVVFEAVVGHALAFMTWRTLAGGGLTGEQVVAFLVGLVAAVADGSILADWPPAPTSARPSSGD